MTFSITKNVKFNKNDKWHNDSECQVSKLNLLNVVMPSAVTLSVIMLSVVMLRIVLLAECRYVECSYA
jgi:predicted transporter